MIRSFRDKGLKRFVDNGDRSKLSVPNTVRLERILQRLNVAVRPEEMNLPGWRFHALRGDRAGRYAVDASGNWRVTFAWDGEDAVDVDLEDYH
jgi:proteic killer suppression protein